MSDQEALGQISITVFDGHGDVDRIVRCPRNMVSIQCRDNEVFAFGEFSALEYYRQFNGTVTAYTDAQKTAKRTRPTAAIRWSNESMSWIMPAISYLMPILREETWARIKSARESMEFGPFTCNDHVFDGDAVSRSRLGVALEGAKEAIAAGNTTWTKPWKLANNTAITLTAPELLDVVRAHGDNMEQAHVTAAILAYFIDTATTPEELEAIQWPA